MNRRYRVRVANAGASTVTGNVDFTLDLGLLIEPPVITGAVTHPTIGRTEMMPFQVRSLFPDSVIAELVANERWTAVGRLIDVGWQETTDDPDLDPWTVYGTGRISAMSEPDGRGVVELEVSDESWQARRVGVFAPDPDNLATTQNTTQLWPSGPKRAWRGLPQAHTATGTLETSQGQLYRIKMVGGGSNKQHGRQVTEKLVRLLQNDIIADPVLTSAPTEGNFRTVLLNYAGTDYEIVSFGQAVLDRDDSGSGEVFFPYDADGLVPEDIGAVTDEGSRVEKVTIYAWIVAGSAPPSSGNAYLHAPSAHPSEDTPLHIGLDWDGHRWGESGGWMHMADLTRRYFDTAGMAYDETALTEREGDPSVPAIAPVVHKEPEDEWVWFEEEIWGPSSHMVMRSASGPKLVDMRLPQDVDPDTLTVLDASNTDAYSWALVGREIVTSVTYRYLSVTAGSGQERAALDGYIYSNVDGEPILADTQALAASGKRDVRHSISGVLEPTAAGFRNTSVRLANRGAVFGQVVNELANDILDIYRDGAWRMSLEIDGSVDMSEGDNCILDMASLKAANPDTQSRTGLRLVRILSLETYPTHFVAEIIDLGPKLAPLAAPTISLSQDTDRHFVVTLSGTPAGAEATVEVAYTSTTTAPTSWIEQRSGLGDGNHIFRDPPRTGYAHARVRSRAANRIRSPWATPYPIALLPDPSIIGLSVTVDEAGIPTVYGTPNSNTAGVRIRFVIHDVGDAPVFPA